MFKQRSKKLLSLLAAGLLLIGAALGSWAPAFGANPQYFYYEPDVANKTEARLNGELVNEQICEEGVVLLKNENNALPLAGGAKISVFGKNSVNLVYGGSGSVGGAGNEYVKSLFESLADAGFVYNPALKAFYENNNLSGPGRPKNLSMGVPSISTGETPSGSYTQDVKSSYAQYNDAALVVFSRIGGEGFDLPREGGYGANAINPDDHYLQLDKNETGLLADVCAAFDEVIVIINSSTPMELGFLDDPAHYAYHPQIKGALWIGAPGDTGIRALARILRGTVNPSGRLPDTWARNFKNDPTWQNFGTNGGGNAYTVPGGKFGGTELNEHFVDYEEGVYVGYRYYETRGFI